jgi:hypothetical protein
MVSKYDNLNILDSLISQLSQDNDYKETQQFYTETAPLTNVHYVRVLSNQRCLISTNLVKQNYYLDMSVPPSSQNLSLTSSSIIYVGDANIWYKTSSDYINSVSVELVDRAPELEGTTISLEFEFLDKHPSFYTRNV